MLQSVAEGDQGLVVDAGLLEEAVDESELGLVLEDLREDLEG